MGTAHQDPLNAVLQMRVRQQRAIAEVGQRALSEGDLQKLFNHSVQVVASVLRTEYCKILELLPSHDKLLLRAGVGWKEGLVGSATVDIGLDSQAGYTLATDAPVIVEDLRRETRFSGPPLLHDHRVVSGMSCVIVGVDGLPWGVLGAHTTRLQLFSEDDVTFLQAIANTLSAIIQRRSIEGDFQESERRLRAMIDALPAAVYTTDAEGQITHFNPAAVEFSGRVPELGTDHWCVTWRLYHPDGTPMPHDECPMALALQGRDVAPGQEVIAERPDGKRTWFTAHPTALRDAEGRIVGGINMLVDITGRKHAERLRLQLASIVESAEDAIIGKTLDGTIVSWNGAAEQIYGYTASEAIGKSISILLPADRKDELPTILERLGRGERIEHYETKRQRKDGTVIDVSVTISPIKTETGKIIGASAVARDITERKQAERLRRWRKQQQALARGQDEERRRISRELHDDFAQRLALLSMGLDELKYSFSGDAKASHKIQTFKERIEGLSDDIRSLSHRLHPSLLDLLGLQPSLEAECQRISETAGLPIHFASAPLPKDLLPDLALALYRVAQEALRNVVEHAQAKQARVTLSTDEDELRLIIEDDGKGFDPNARNKGSLGLLSMSERLELFEGDLSIDSQLGRGTRVEAVVRIRRCAGKGPVPREVAVSMDRLTG